MIDFKSLPWHDGRIPELGRLLVQDFVFQDSKKAARFISAGGDGWLQYRSHIVLFQQDVSRCVSGDSDDPGPILCGERIQEPLSDGRLVSLHLRYAAGAWLAWRYTLSLLEQGEGIPVLVFRSEHPTTESPSLGAVGKEAAGNSRLGPRRGAPGASRDGSCRISGVEGVLEYVEAHDVQQGPAQQRMAHRSGPELSRRLLRMSYLNCWRARSHEGLAQWRPMLGVFAGWKKPGEPS